MILARAAITTNLGNKLGTPSTSGLDLKDGKCYFHAPCLTLIYLLHEGALLGVLLWLERLHRQLQVLGCQGTNLVQAKN